MGPSIPYFEVVGNGRQDAGDVLQGGGLSNTLVWIGGIVHDRAHQQGDGVILP